MRLCSVLLDKELLLLHSFSPLGQTDSVTKHMSFTCNLHGNSQAHSSVLSIFPCHFSSHPKESNRTCWTGNTSRRGKPCDEERQLEDICESDTATLSMHYFLFAQMTCPRHKAMRIIAIRPILSSNTRRAYTPLLRRPGVHTKKAQQRRKKWMKRA